MNTQNVGHGLVAPTREKWVFITGFFIEKKKKNHDLNKDRIRLMAAIVCVRCNKYVDCEFISAIVFAQRNKKIVLHFIVITVIASCGYDVVYYY